MLLFLQKSPWAHRTSPAKLEGFFLKHCSRCESNLQASTNELGDVLAPSHPLNLLGARSCSFPAKADRGIHKGGSAPGAEQLDEADVTSDHASPKLQEDQGYPSAQLAAIYSPKPIKPTAKRQQVSCSFHPQVSAALKLIQVAQRASSGFSLGFSSSSGCWLLPCLCSSVCLAGMAGQGSCSTCLGRPAVAVYF